PGVTVDDQEEVGLAGGGDGPGHEAVLELLDAERGGAVDAAQVGVGAAPRLGPVDGGGADGVDGQPLGHAAQGGAVVDAAAAAEAAAGGGGDGAVGLQHGGQAGGAGQHQAAGVAHEVAGVRIEPVEAGEGGDGLTVGAQGVGDGRMNPPPHPFVQV